MSKIVTESGFNFYEGGYFCVFPEDVFSDDLYADWHELYQAFSSAKSGDFDRLKILVPLVGTSSDAILNAATATLLADAATDDVYDQVATDADATGTFEHARYASRIVAGRGTLSDVTFQIDQVRRFSHVGDLGAMTLSVSSIIDPGEPEHLSVRSFDSVNDYCASAGRRCQQLAELHGTAPPYFKGEPFSVPALATKLLARLEQRHLPSYWREKLEASTGIDCSDFYRDGSPQNLAAAAIVEQFIESGEADRYEPGVRYFFGHRIPPR